MRNRTKYFVILIIVLAIGGAFFILNQRELVGREDLSSYALKQGLPSDIIEIFIKM